MMKNRLKWYRHIVRAGEDSFIKRPINFVVDARGVRG